MFAPGFERDLGLGGRWENQAVIILHFFWASVKLVQVSIPNLRRLHAQAES